MNYIDHKASLELNDPEYKILHDLQSIPLEKLFQRLPQLCDFSLTKSGDVFQPIFGAKINSQNSLEIDSYGTLLYYLNRLEKHDENSNLSAFIKAYMSALMGKMFFPRKEHTENKLRNFFNRNAKSNLMGIYNIKAFPRVKYELESTASNTEINLGYIHDIPCIPFSIKKKNRKKEIGYFSIIILVER